MIAALGIADWPICRQLFSSGKFIMHVEGYDHFGGRHSESAALKNLMAFHGVADPFTGKPLSEALCFGIAGGIGAGYSFCPSVIRHGCGSGVAVVGRHKAYATGDAWYRAFSERLGLTARITETAAPGKAFANLKAEIGQGRPAVVWCSRERLPFLGNVTPNDLNMYTFIVHAIDEPNGAAYGADRVGTAVRIPLSDLADARNGVCSHKNRTLSFDPPPIITKEQLQHAARAGLRACVQELVQGKMKTYSLPGLQILAKALTNTKSADGWPRVYTGPLLNLALRDLFHSIETSDTDGGLYRNLFADFLSEASRLLAEPRLAELAGTYRNLANRWTDLAEAALPNRVKPYKLAKELLRKKQQLLTHNAPQPAALSRTADKLQAAGMELRKAALLDDDAAARLLSELKDRVTELHADEHRAALQLAIAAA